MSTWTPTMLTDKQLEDAYDNALADLALADKYEHNAHLRTPIRTTLDLLEAERKRRTPAHHVDGDTR